MFRLRRVGKPVTGEVEGAVKMTPEVIEKVVKRLARSPAHKDPTAVRLPAEALAAIDVEAADQLVISVENGRIVLTPTSRQRSAGGAP